MIVIGFSKVLEKIHLLKWCRRWMSCELQQYVDILHLGFIFITSLSSLPPEWVATRNITGDLLSPSVYNLLSYFLNIIEGRLFGQVKHHQIDICSE